MRWVFANRAFFVVNRAETYHSEAKRSAGARVAACKPLLLLNLDKRDLISI